MDSLIPLVLLLAAVVLLACALACLRPFDMRRQFPPNMVPIRDDELALRNCPTFACKEELGRILAIYYRAAIHTETGLVHIAYHPVWDREVNTSATLGGLVSRHFYTGGLALQRLIYGKEDVECIGIVIDPSHDERVVSIHYETADDYNEGNLFVRHAPVEEHGGVFERPLCFKIISWNHLSVRISRRTGGDLESARSDCSAPPLSYFTCELWNEYSMTKRVETLFNRDRAHFAWEINSC